MRDSDLGRSGARYFEELRTEGGYLAAWEVVPRIFVTVAEGHMQEAHAEIVVRVGDKIAELGRPMAGFNEWSAMTSYDSVTRKLLTDWVSEHRHQLVASHVSVDSRLVQMGVTVANLALDGLLRSHATRAELVLAFEKFVADGGVNRR